MPFTLPELTYNYAALEPHVDALTMNIHHTKHHQVKIQGVDVDLRNARAASDGRVTSWMLMGRWLQ